VYTVGGQVMPGQYIFPFSFVLPHGPVNPFLLIFCRPAAVINVAAVEVCSLVLRFWPIRPLNNQHNCEPSTNPFKTGL
jgi:hypothetical protein